MTAQHRVVNYKKELGMSLQAMKQETWFKELDKETQDIAIEQQKSYFTPPNDMSNCLMKIAIGDDPEWREFLKNSMPWADPNSNSIDVKMARKDYFTSKPKLWERFAN